MTTAAKHPNHYPHIQFRPAGGSLEAYVFDAGLTVWEIAWLAQFYGGDAEAIALHTLADRRLIEEALGYATEHQSEIDVEIARHTEVSLPELRALLPRIRVVTIGS